MSSSHSPMRMAQLPPESRPRERLMAHGAAALTDAELLAILLRTGTRGRGVLDMAHELLREFEGLAGLLSADAPQLARIKGLGGSAKRSELLAVMELAKRALRQQLAAREVFHNPQAVRDFLQAHLAHRPHEVFAVLYLDAQHRLIVMEDMFRGTLTQTSVYPREVVTRALHHHASAVVLAHNHPSGAAEPSRADEALTQSLRAALALVDVRVLDHLIVARGSSVSMAERGLM